MKETVRQGSLEHKHCDTVIVVLITQTATVWLTSMRHLGHGEAGWLDDSCPG